MGMDVRTRLLLKVSEEASECAQASNKLAVETMNGLRPNKLAARLSNFKDEYNDLIAATELLKEHGFDLDAMVDRKYIEKKKRSFRRGIRKAVDSGVVSASDEDLELLLQDLQAVT